MKPKPYVKTMFSKRKTSCMSQFRSVIIPNLVFTVWELFNVNDLIYENISNARLEVAYAD